MTREEVKGILAVMKVGYPNFYKDLRPSDADQIINLWSTMFQDDSVKIVTEAVKALMCTLKFPPTIADVKEKIALITQPQQLTEIEAWNKVKSAISFYNAKEGFDKLPPMLKKLVGSPNQLREWAVMASENVESVVKSNFMRSYTVKVRQESERAMLPVSTRDLIAGMTEKMTLTDGNNKKTMNNLEGRS